MPGHRGSRMTCARASHGIATTFFVYATYVQLNDPDAAKWMAFYGSAALYCLTHVFAKAPKYDVQLSCMYACVMVAFFVDHVSSAGSVSFDVHTEIGRECSGVLIAISWVLLHCLTAQSKSLLVSFAVTAAALAGVASVIYVSTSLLSPSDATGHCSGLGLQPNADDSLLS